MIINTVLFLSVSSAVSNNAKLNKVVFIFNSYRRDYEAERSLVKSEEILHEELSVLVPLLHPHSRVMGWDRQVLPLTLSKERNSSKWPGRELDVCMYVPWDSLKSKIEATLSEGRSERCLERSLPSKVTIQRKKMHEYPCSKEVHSWKRTMKGSSLILLQ